MKVNLPVTQREKPFPPGRYLVSKTDLQGIITYANDAFVMLSGFSRDELIGKNHNIVRHPDMPPQAFEDLWRTAKEGLPWRGIVKNRAKSGDHYWVDAFVVPIRENDRTIGYMSVRSEPSRSAVEQAEAFYQQLNRSKAALDSRPPLVQRLSIRTRLLAVMGCMAALLLGGAIIGIGGLTMTNDALERTYQIRMEPVYMVGRATALMSDNRAQIMLGLQHNPANPFSKFHDHPMTRHTDAIARNHEEIAVLMGALGKQEFGAALKPMLDEYTSAHATFVASGLMPARQALLDGNFDIANETLLKSTNPVYEKAAAAAWKLSDGLKNSAREEHAASQSRYRFIRNFAVGGSLAALLLTAFAASFLLRAIVGPLKRVIGHFDHIAQGNLTDEIDISGRDEAGRVLTQLASMQVHLKVMLDEIQAASRAIESQSAQVESQTRSVADQSERQRDRTASVAAATEQFTQSVREVASSAAHTAKAAVSAQEQVQLAQVSMEQSTAATGRVVNAVQSSSDTIADLDQAIAKIGGITQVIQEIADQTNLLALNAAIEAARAGEMGRGFAVVADEVRKLAERTTASTTDITATVAEIRKVTDATVTSMNHAVTEVEQGIGMVRESVAGLDRITSTSAEVTGMARHIADAANEQTSAAELVASNMEQIATLIDDNLAAVQGAKQAADTLKETAHELHRVVGQFKVIG